MNPATPFSGFELGTIDNIAPVEERPQFVTLANEIINDLFSSGKLHKLVIQTEFT